MQQMQISFSQKGMTVAVGERQVLLGRRSRLTVAVLFTLLVHSVILWSLIANREKDMDIHIVYDDSVDTELYRPEPVPEEVTPPVHHLRETPVTTIPAPSRPRVEPAPSPQPAPQPAPVQAQVEPTPAPPQIKVAPRPVETLQPVNTPVAKAVPQPQTSVQEASATIPTVSDEPAPSPMKVKKKEEEQALETKRQMAAVAAPTDLSLHETPVPNVQDSAIAPSGLTANPSARLAQGGGTPSGGAAAAAGGGQGASGLKGRGNATQALQNHENCIIRQTEGKPIPADCHMKDYAAMKPLGPPANAALQAAAAKRDAHLKYKTDPGNHDYWENVGHNPDAGYHRNEDAPNAGAFARARDQRMITNGANH